MEELERTWMKEKGWRMLSECERIGGWGRSLGEREGERVEEREQQRKGLEEER